jgi:RNA polymerase sigma factor (sigma-70 family)
MDANALQTIACWCVKRRARRLAVQQADMDDLRQDVLVRLLLAVPKHRPERSPLAAFLFLAGRRAAHRAVQRLLRERRRAGRPLRREDDRPADHRFGLDDRDEVAHLLDGLPAGQRATIEACFFQGKGQGEYALARGKHRNCATNTIAQAVLRMRRKASSSRGKAHDEAA